MKWVSELSGHLRNSKLSIWMGKKCGKRTSSGALPPSGGIYNFVLRQWCVCYCSRFGRYINTERFDDNDLKVEFRNKIKTNRRRLKRNMDKLMHFLVCSRVSASSKSTIYLIKWFNYWQKIFSYFLKKCVEKIMI